MSDLLISEEVSVSVPGVRNRTPDQHPRQSAAIERAKTVIALFDENVRLRPLPSVALALALGFIAARLASRYTRV